MSFNNFSNPFVLCPLFLSIVQYQKTFVFLYRIFAPRGAFLPSPELLNIRKQRRFFKPINTLSTNRLHSISVSSGIKKTTSYWYHQKKDYFCIIKRTFICILLCQNTSDNQALTKPVFTQKSLVKHHFSPISPKFTLKRPFPPVSRTIFSPAKHLRPPPAQRPPLPTTIRFAPNSPISKNQLKQQNDNTTQLHSQNGETTPKGDGGMKIII